MKHPFDETKLDAFLKAHQPVPPSAAHDEQQRLQRAIGKHSPARYWPAVIGIAAAVLLYIAFHLPGNLPGPSLAVDDAAYLVEFMDDIGQEDFNDVTYNDDELDAVLADPFDDLDA